MQFPDEKNLILMLSLLFLYFKKFSFKTNIIMNKSCFAKYKNIFPFIAELG